MKSRKFLSVFISVVVVLCFQCCKPKQEPVKQEPVPEAKEEKAAAGEPTPAEEPKKASPYDGLPEPGTRTVKGGIVLEEVSFESKGPTGDCELRGTLSMPKEPGQYPAGIIIHGSGSQNRNLDYTTPDGRNIHPYKDIAEHLSKEGFAVLRYDKRSYLCTKTMINPEATPDIFVDDAKTALRYLAGREEVAKDRLFVVGHSQGANFAHIVAADSDAGVAAVILMAGIFEPIDETLIRQFGDWENDPTLSQKQKADPAAVKYFDDMKEKLPGLFKQIREGSYPPDKPAVGKNDHARFWKEWIAMTEGAKDDVKKVTCPLLYVRGSDDWEVQESNVKTLDAAMKGRKNYASISIEGLGHLFVRPTSMVVDKELLDKLTAWMKSVL
ncbi:MAG: alpha/beta fold hydrolase [Pseudomonadota bacterium]